MILFKNITKLDGMFQNCHMEPTIHGFSLFDRNNEFVGEVLNEGFAVNSKYKYAEKIQVQLIKKGINVFDIETFELVKNEQDLAEILYG